LGSLSSASLPESFNEYLCCTHPRPMCFGVLRSLSDFYTLAIIRPERESSRENKRLSGRVLKNHGVRLRRNLNEEIRRRLECSVLYSLISIFSNSPAAPLCLPGSPIFIVDHDNTNLKRLKRQCKRHNDRRHIAK
jgi:hypothetical protein